MEDTTGNKETVTTVESTSSEETVVETYTTAEVTSYEETVAETVTSEESTETDEVTESTTSTEVEESSQISEETTEEETKPSKYTALEFSASDSGVGANHNMDIKLETTKYFDTTLKELKNINLLGFDYNAEYKESQNSYYYNVDVDCYESTIRKEYDYEFEINRKTGRVDRCLLFQFNYLSTKGSSPKLSKEECENIALNILSQYVNTDDYILKDSYKSFYTTGGRYETYIFSFVRVIDGIETKDNAYIEITEYGDLIQYIFTCLGEMKDAVAPTKEEISMMQDAVDEKVKSIYSNIEKSYGVEYEIRDEYFVRLADGKYAMEYVVDVDLTPNDPEGLTLKEKISLLVYV